MIAGLKDQFGNMWNGQSYKSNWSRKSGDTSRQNTRCQDDDQSGFFVVHSHTSGVVFAKQQSIQGFDVYQT